MSQYEPTVLKAGLLVADGLVAVFQVSRVKKLKVAIILRKGCIYPSRGVS